MSQYTILQTTHQNALDHQKQLDECYQVWSNMFGDNTTAVLENVMSILGMVQNNMSAGKDPFKAVKPEQQQALLDVISGVKALQTAGPGGDAQALHGFIERVRNKNQNLTPQQSEVAAIKMAGKNSAAAKGIQQAFQQYQQALANGDTQAADKLKNQFSKLYMFYQELYNKSNSQQQKPMQNVQQKPTQNPSANDQPRDMKRQVSQRAQPIQQQNVPVQQPSQFS